MDENKSYLTFKIGKEYYATRVSYIHNILEYNVDITKIPDMPKYMTGVINLRGQALPIIDSRMKLGLSKAEISIDTCILVIEAKIEKNKVMVGLLVDTVDEVLELNQKKIKATPGISKTEKNEFIEGIYSYDEKFIIELNMDKFFSSPEVKMEIA